MAELPAVPITLDGSYVLHQMYRLERRGWRAVTDLQRAHILKEAANLFSTMEKGGGGTHPNQTALYSLIGHKGDLMFVHFRDSLEELHRADLEVSQVELADYLVPAYSFVSVVELGLYESTSKTYAQLAEQGIEPHSPEWNAGVAETVARQAAAMAPRLFPEIPPAKYLCFYPMDRKRGQKRNWYLEPMPERQRMMHEHGMIGRRYADSVRQIITGAIGLDDWEWGVDLFGDDPLVFKKLIYEMRFDEVSAVYASFGQFFVGVRVAGSAISSVLSGHLP